MPKVLLIQIHQQIISIKKIGLTVPESLPAAGAMRFCEMPCFVWAGSRGQGAGGLEISVL
ncbi:hypothetical protein [Nostoc sp.]